MYSPSNFGLSADILKVVSSVMEEGRRITKENLAEQVASGVWNIEGQSGSVVSVYDTSSRTRFKLEVLDEMKMKNSDAALKLKKEISSLETSISKLTPLARKDDSANMKLVASKKRLEAKKAEHSKLMKEESYKTSAGATEAKVVQAVGQIKHFAKEMYKGDIKKAYNDWAGKTTFGPVLKAEVLKRAGGVNEATDPVDKKELTKSFEKRKDKDIDNDGDTDSSDEYLHKRRKAISKAMKEESDVDEGFINLGGAKVKDDEKSILQHIKKTFPNVKKVKKDSQHGWIPVFEEVELDELSKKTLGSYVKGASHDIATKSAATGRYAERANKASDDMKKTGNYSQYTQKRKDDETADKMFNKSWKRRLGVAKAVDKLTKEEVELDEAKMEAAVEKTQADINHAQKYMKAADNHGDVIKHMNRLSMLRKQLSYQKAKLKEAKETDAEMEDEDGDGEKDKKKKKGKFEKYDIVNTKPSDDKNKTMMQTDEEVELDELSKKTLGSYVKKASHDVATKAAATGRYAERANKASDDMKASGDYSLHMKKRKDDETADKMFKKSWKRRLGIGKAIDKMTKEEFELREAEAVKRGRGRPRKDAAASSETTDSGDRHIVNQMRKAVSLNGHHVVFDNGEKKHVDRVTAQAFINKYNNLDKPMHKEIISKSAIKSHEHFKNALKGKVEAPKSNKIDMPKLKSDVMTGKY